MTRRTLVLLGALSLLTGSSAPRQQVVARHAASGPLQQVTFTTAQGTVRVNLPLDAASGDRVGGTVIREPTGSTDGERARNRSTLEGYVVEAPEVSRGPLATTFSLRLRGDESSRATTFVLRDASSSLTTWSGKIAGPAIMEPLPPQLPLPTIGQAGRPLPILGSFDGDASNTLVRAGGQPAEVLAESPRRTIVNVPERAGMTDLAVADGDEGRTGPLRIVTVDLSAGKTNLTRGESTELTIRVGGLQNLTDSLPLDMAASGFVSASGGNRQRMIVAPAAVDAGGSFTTTRTLTAERAGNFGVTVSVLLPLPCALLNQTVHVEGGVGGSSTVDMWYVNVKQPGGKPFRVRVKSDSKPALKYCQWIVIGGCGTTADGDPVVEAWKLTGDPTKKKAPPAAGAGGTAPGGGAIKPPAPGPTKPPSGGTQPQPPCAEGEERNPSTAETREFKVAAAWSKPELHVGTNLDGATSAAENMAGLWKKAFDLGGIGKYVIPRGAGKTPIGLLLEYLNQGSTVLLGIADSKLTRNLDSVTLSISMETLTYKVTKWTVEVCHGGGWVKEVRCSKAKPEASSLSEFITLKRGTRAWEAIEDPDNIRLVSRSRLEAYAKAWFSEQLQKVEDDANKMKEFTKDCPP